MYFLALVLLGSEKFDFQVKLKSIKLKALSEKDKDQHFKGTWDFKVPVKVDKSISKNIDVNYKKDNGFSLDSILVTPVQLVIKSTNPENTHYGIKVFDDKNNELTIECGKLNDKHQVTYTSPDKDVNNLKIIIYRDKVVEKETNKNSNGSSQTTYDNLGQEILLEKTVEIK